MRTIGRGAKRWSEGAEALTCIEGRSTIASSRTAPWDTSRGTAEQWITEGKHAVRWTRFSCHEFDDNQVRLQRFPLAYNLVNSLR